MANALAEISKARQALAVAKSLEDVMHIRDQAKAVETYLKAASESLEAQNQAAEIKVRAERKAGELISKMEKAKNQHDVKKCSSQAGKSKAEQLDSIGLSTSQANRLEQMAAVPEETFEELSDADSATSEGREITSASIRRGCKPHVANNSGENEWYTPLMYIDAVREVMGSIDLDPATSEHAQKTVNAETYLTVKDDGLAYEWSGNVWLNPPYEKGLIDKFAEKVSELEFEQAIVLVNNATETGWCQLLLSKANAVCMPSGRIRFLAVDGVKNSPLQGQIFLYFGPRKKSFAKVFSEFGPCMEVIK